MNNYPSSIVELSIKDMQYNTQQKECRFPNTGVASRTWSITR